MADKSSFCFQYDDNAMQENDATGHATIVVSNSILENLDVHLIFPYFSLSFLYFFVIFYFLCLSLSSQTYNVEKIE